MAGRLRPARPRSGAWAARGLLVLAAVLLALLVRPLQALGASPWSSPGANVAAALLAAGIAIALEQGLRRWDPWTGAGVAAGIVVGGLVARALAPLLPTLAVEPLVVLVALYAGATLGVRLARALREGAPRTGRRPAEPAPGGHKLLDTSVIIDGRIADVCEAGFLEGVLVVPGFVLAELQHIADSSEPTRRARGRKGLESLQRITAQPAVKVVFSEEDLPEIREVDLKLVELARRLGAKLLTNDVNLKKVAGLRGVPVLSLHELARAMKPVVLAGEMLTVTILREGKEPGQGVAYLDDGTMVVVDGGRPLIGRSVEVVLTSVLQTSAGKMFFARPAAAVPAEPQKG